MKRFTVKYSQTGGKTDSFNDAIKLLEEIFSNLVISQKKKRAKLIINEYKDITPRNGRYSTELLQKSKFSMKNSCPNIQQKPVTAYSQSQAFLCKTFLCFICLITLILIQFSINRIPLNCLLTLNSNPFTKTSIKILTISYYTIEYSTNIILLLNCCFAKF